MSGLGIWQDTSSDQTERVRQRGRAPTMLRSALIHTEDTEQQLCVTRVSAVAVAEAAVARTQDMVSWVVLVRASRCVELR